jgi:hypothetical protein
MSPNDGGDGESDQRWCHLKADGRRPFHLPHPSFEIVDL